MRLSHVAAGLMTAVALAVGVWIFDRSETQRYREEIRAATLRDLSALRARAESSLNKRLYLTMGLRAYVACNPDITPEQFAAFAAALQREGEGIRSLTLIKNNVINDVYPRAGNEGAIGLKLLEHPRQRAAAMRAIATKQSWLAGPISLVQGGEAFIHRVPVFESVAGDPSSDGRYWGMVSILIDKDKLIDEILRDAPSNVQVAIRGIDAMGSRGGYFVGDALLEQESPLSLTIALPNGQWQALGVPAGGWPSQAPHSSAIQLSGGFAAILIGALIWQLLHSRSRFWDASRAADAASNAKTEFLSNMSHEIRTPMTAILGYADILAEQADTESIAQRSEKVTAIRNNARHLITVINDILDMSKIEAGKLTIEQTEIHPASIAEEVVELLKDRACAKGITLSVEYQNAIPLHIISDSTRLRQILVNLVGNAIKFTEAGSVTIVMSLEESPRPQIRFAVRDTGIGMTADQLEKISNFEAFNQADTTTTRRFGGSGLGLRISNSLAQKLGGALELKSTHGEGSTFALIIPTGDLKNAELLAPEQAAQDRAKRAPRVKPAKADQGQPLTGMRLLLAEDGIDNQRLIFFLLNRAGAAVDIVDNGKLACEKAFQELEADRPYDVILMDMQMPVMDGYTAARRLRDEGYDHPVIALTAHAMAEDRRKCLEAGADEFATKPIDRDRLITLLASFKSKAEQPQLAANASCPLG